VDVVFHSTLLCVFAIREIRLLSRAASASAFSGQREWEGWFYLCIPEVRADVVGLMAKLKRYYLVHILGCIARAA
jgi:hypothetical protein